MTQAKEAEIDSIGFPVFIANQITCFYLLKAHGYSMKVAISHV